MGHAWVNVAKFSDEDYKEWAAKHKPQKTAASYRAAGAGTGQ